MSHKVYGRSWTAVSRRYREQQPLCESCRAEGRVRLGEERHHIVPIRIAPERRLDVDNLLNLCRPCHERLEAMYESDIDGYQTLVASIKHPRGGNFV